MNLVLAALSPSAAAALDRLRDIPMEFWWKLGIGILAVIVAVVIMRKVAKMNRLMLAMGLFFVATTIGINWIYERNKPSWATPVIQVVANFLPTKGRVHI
jgi:hypothetical protein